MLKKVKASAVICFMIIALFGSFGFSQENEKDGFLKVPVGISYSSIYWWRGTELNGKGTGVFWPSAGLEFGDTGFSISVAAGINADYLMADESVDRKEADDLNEFDYGVAYEKGIGDILTLSLGLMYVHYPFAEYGSFVEGSISAGLNLPLSPTLDIYYDYYVSENEDDTDAPQSEDYYVKFSVSQELASTDNFSTSLGAWIAYYNDPYFDASGLSDAGVNLSVEQTYKEVTFSSAFNYARSLSDDFQADNGSGKLKNHFWVDFGVSTSL